MELRLTSQEGLPNRVRKGKTHRFNRNALRRYAVNELCYLFNDRAERPLAVVKITEFEIGAEKTSGFFEVVDRYPRSHS